MIPIHRPGPEAMRRARRALLLTMFLLALPAAGWAQTELAREHASLKGISGFYLSLNVEGPAAVLGEPALDFHALTTRLRARLEAAGLPLYPEAEMDPAARVPYLHVHVNTMAAGRGLVPFGVEVRFFQAVRLARRPGATTVAATWSTSLVGLVSHDQLALIPEATADLVEEFIVAFRQVNL